MAQTISDNGVTYGATAAEHSLYSIGASVSGNALTITLAPTTIAFRSSTLTSGTPTVVQNSSTLSLTISSGSTLGTVNNQQSRIVVLAINNAGTMELAAVNIAGGNQLDETNLISTTAEGGAGAADSASTIYSTTARSNVAYKVVGYVESTQATAGTWATTPSTVQGAGGNALSAMGSMGYGQTWQDVAGSRAAGTTYYNITGKPIFVNAVFQINSSGQANLVLNGVSSLIGFNAAATNIYCPVTFTVTPGESYRINTSGASTVAAWLERR